MHNARFPDGAAVMNQEVHIYLAVGKAAAGGTYPTGQSHALHVYLREPVDAPFDGRAAEAVALGKGWVLTEIRKASRITPESIQAAEDTVRACYEAALKDGSAILVYDTPVGALD